MSPNRRIALNVLATYGRSLYAMVIGLFTVRWALMALGQTDYGLIGVVGGLIGFVSFFNTLLGTTVGRFYAFSVGARENDCSQSALEDSRKWFNSALMLHTVVAMLLIVVGYPIGKWAINNFLTIPDDRIGACGWVWLFVCSSCFIGMVNVPFQAMYTAKQEIAELTIYSFITTTLNFVFLYYIVNHPAVWLVKYAAWTALLSIVPQIIICIRAIIKYQECRFNYKYLYSWPRLKELFIFAGSKSACSVAYLLGNQGAAILVNKMLGPVKNAAMTIGNTISGQCMTLSNAFVTAFSPAITNAAGARDYERMRKLMYTTCSVSVVALLIFMLPLLLEVKGVLNLWLETPPDGSYIICISMLFVDLFERLSCGLWMGLLAIGKVVAFQTLEGVVVVLSLPIAFVLMWIGADILGLGIALTVTKSVTVLIKLYYARKYCGISARVWCFRMALPLALISVVSMVPGLVIINVMESSFLRIVLTTIAIEIVFLPCCWFLVLPVTIRGQVKSKIVSATHIHNWRVK